MLRYIINRLLTLIPLLFGVSLFVFCVLRLGKTDPALAYARLSGLPATDAILTDIRLELGLNNPLWQQYLDWLWAALHGDMGLSYVSAKPALDEILYFLPATLELTFWAICLTAALSIPLGIISAYYKDKLPDYAIRIMSFSAVSTPSFWLGFLLMLFFTKYFGFLPTMGRDGTSSLILPVLTLSFMSIGINARLVRASMLEHMHSRSVIYAKAIGTPKHKIMLHIIRNACIPVLTTLSMHLGELIGGAVIVENIFNWPGVGRYVLTAIYNHDYPVIQSFILVMACIFVIINLGVDILYAKIDPRIARSQNMSRESI